MPGFTELEVEMPFDDGSVVGVVYLMAYEESSVMAATCFHAFFQPLRRLLYGPDDERLRMRLWQRLPAVRPLFMAANYNGMNFKFDDVALLQKKDPAHDASNNLIVSVDYGRTAGQELDDAIVSRTLGLLEFSLRLYEEALIPLDLEGLYRGMEVTELLDVAGSAAKWLMKHAGEIGDVLDLIDELTD
jgi:hypothetical protein